MGNQNSNDSSLFSIRMDLDSSTYFTGEEVSGTIHLFIYSPFTPSTLFLNFSGNEVTKHPATHTGSKTCHRTKNEKNKILIITSTFPVCSWSTTLNQGTHSLPYKFMLPSEIPGSFSYKSSEEIRISYKLKAYIQHNKIKVSTKLPIILRQDCIDFSKKKPEKPFFHFFGLRKHNKGKCELRVILNNEPYCCDDEDAEIKVEIDNKESLVLIEELEVSLYYIIDLDKGENKSTFSGRILRKRERVRVLPGQGRVGDDAVKVRLNLPRRKKLFNVVPSVRGATFESYFYVVAQVRSGGLFDCYNKTPSVMAFIKILPEIEVKNIVPIKPMYSRTYKYESIDLKECNRNGLETCEQEKEEEEEEKEEE